MAGIGFTLPYLPLYLREQGMSNRTIGIVSALAALAGLLQFPAGVWSDRLRARKPFLIVALAVLAASTFLMQGSHELIWLSFLVVLFAENGACRATVESMAGAEAVHLAPPDQVGAALGVLRFFRPIGIIVVLVGGGILAGHYGMSSILLPIGIVQTLAVFAALLIHEPKAFQTETLLPNRDVIHGARHLLAVNGRIEEPSKRSIWRDSSLWAFMVAMLLFHSAAAPGGVYLGLFLEKDLGASKDFLPYVFVVMMIAWMLVVWPAGALADRIGRRPLLLLAWSAMTIRLALIAVAGSPEWILLIQVLDGLAQGLFGVLAAAWVTDRFADGRRAGEAQVLVGSCLVLGSALGPLLAGLVVDAVGYRGLFGLLAGVAGIATLVVLALVPETLEVRKRESALICHPAAPARVK